MVHGDGIFLIDAAAIDDKLAEASDLFGCIPKTSKKCELPCREHKENGGAYLT